MIKANDEQNDVASAARQLCEQELRELLEPKHQDEFVAIEPISGDYFLGKTLSDAIGAAGAKYPDRLSHAVRVGHKAGHSFIT